MGVRAIAIALASRSARRPHPSKMISTATGGRRAGPLIARSRRARNARCAGPDARAPSSSAMRSRRLYLAVRSPRLIEPVLICPAPVATARSAMVVSSVSPERCEMTQVKPAARAISIVSSVSVSVPIWLSLIRIELRGVFADAAFQALGIGHEEIVADELHARAKLPRQRLPSRPVVLGEAIFDRDDRVAVDPIAHTGATICSESRAFLSERANT